MWMYQNENDALTDVLRLSRGMTYKELQFRTYLGGGKAVIGDSKKDRQSLVQKVWTVCELFNWQVHHCRRWQGTSTKDMEYISEKHVTGLLESMGGSGDHHL